MKLWLSVRFGALCPTFDGKRSIFDMAKTRITLFGCFVIILAMTFGSSARGGDLLVYNTGPNAATCTVDGYTKASGFSSDAVFRVEPGGKLTVPPNLDSNSSILNWVDCGIGLRTRAMNITAEGPNGVLFFNGRQTRTLNVILYSAIPTDPTLGYEALVRGLTLRYQAKHPDVLLSLVLNPAIDTYDFDNLKSNVLGPAGFDVAELDTVFLQYLVKNALITPAQITGDEPWPVGKEAAIVDGTLYGVPSWLCSDFLFSSDSKLSSIRTFDQMKNYLGTVASGRTALVGDLDGSWTVPAIYIQAFVQIHPSTTTTDALKMPADPKVIDRMAELGSACESQSLNPCIDGTYHNAKDGSVEKAFATEHASTDTGFSERSFYLTYFEQIPSTLSLIPIPWGDGQHPSRVVYSDAFVTSKATCAGAPCQSDSTEFSAFMTSADTKKFIALSGDLPTGSPPRHLLVATKAFYSLEDIKGDSLYEQLISTFLSGRMISYPNSFSPELKYQLLSGVCPSLKKKSAGWSCKVPKAL
jgi:thiamine pyridinylase